MIISEREYSENIWYSRRLGIVVHELHKEYFYSGYCKIITAQIPCGSNANAALSTIKNEGSQASLNQM